jgi:hypothetical protein
VPAAEGGLAVYSSDDFHHFRQTPQAGHQQAPQPGTRGDETLAVALESEAVGARTFVRRKTFGGPLHG